MKGIGDITVAGLIGEVGDFREYKTISEILKFAGLDLFEISSGIHKGQRRISKRGRSLMRKLLFFASINVVHKGGIMHEYYQGCLARGMLKMKALTAVSRKLLGVIFALVRDHSEYIGNYAVEQELKKAA
ncbi:MAG: transposase [Candidatus Scalinduaceae bacterium]